MQAESLGKKNLGKRSKSKSSTSRNVEVNNHMDIDIDVEGNSGIKNGQQVRSSTMPNSKGKTRAISPEVDINMQDLNDFCSEEGSGNKLHNWQNRDIPFHQPRSDGMHLLTALMK